MDLDTNCLLTAVAQSCIAFTTFFNRNDHIVASLAPSTELTRNSQKMLYGDTDASLCIVLALSLAFLASECVLHLSIVQSPQLLQMYCLSAHTVACLCLLKFIVDAHPVHHFWWLFSLTNCPITKELAELTTHAERFVGLEGGGMDQACECLARRGEALRIDFRPLGWRAVRLPDNALFAVLHSNTEMNKTASAFYNQRVVECRIAAQVISKRSGCVPSGAEWHSVRTLKQGMNYKSVPADLHHKFYAQIVKKSGKRQGAGWGGCAVALVAKAKRAQVEASGLNVLFWSEPCEGIEAFPFRRQADE
uniref:Transmembrane protein 107 n=1 Tax=Globodera rostochiensis TaxID=31243 RepID=A0A914H3X1_GLORO